MGRRRDGASWAAGWRSRMSSDGLVHVELRTGAYADSVTLLQVSRTVQGIAGVAAAQVAMATTLNVEVLTQMGFVVPPEATANDMVVAVRLEDPEGLDRALAGVDAALREVNRPAAGPRDLAPPRTTATALRGVTDGIVLVSVPGAHAMVEAMDALDAGYDVMIFSDNVPVEQEVELKQVASERGLLVMGPDCGTAVVDGIGLGFANIVQPGPVGIVAASGTGCQQLLALLDHADVGVTVRTRCGWARPVHAGRWGLDPRCAGQAGRRSGGGAHRVGLQATRRDGRREGPVPRRPSSRRPSSWPCSGRASPTSPPRPSPS